MRARPGCRLGQQLLKSRTKKTVPLQSLKAISALATLTCGRAKYSSSLVVFIIVKFFLQLL